ncbi:MAG TPA: CBS domain-containing protein [Steroidobacteraceae bacterium]|nr:CBS domain-containing protein [Steroidobacteraceae bacterium]
MEMVVDNVCTRDVATVRPSDTLFDAARVMRDRHVGDVIVTDDENNPRPVGILTDRDIVVGILAVAPDKLETLLVEDVMSRDLATAQASDALDKALRAMRARGVRRLPVVASDGRLIGIVTFDDLVAAMARELGELATVVARERQREERMRI